MTLNEMKFVDNAITYNRMVNYVEFVVKNSFDEKGRFHQYNYDYALAVALIAMYTDYNDAVGFDEVMEFIHTSEWYAIVEQIGKKYDTFKYYVDCDIESATKPFAFANEVILAAKEVLVQFNEILSIIDKDKLKNYDLTELLNAFEAIGQTNTSNTNMDNNKDNNIVQFDDINKDKD